MQRIFQFVYFLCIYTSCSLIQREQRFKKTHRRAFIENQDKSCVEVGILQSIGQELLNVDTQYYDQNIVNGINNATGGNLAPAGIISFLNWFMGNKISTDEEQVGAQAQKYLGKIKFDERMFELALQLFGKEYGFFETIGNFLKSKIGLICTIGAHIGAGILLPGIGNAIVIGVKKGIQATGLAYTIGQLVYLKNNQETGCGAIIEASRYTTKFILQLVNLASITKRSSKRSTKRNKSRIQQNQQYLVINNRRKLRQARKNRNL